MLTKILPLVFLLVGSGAGVGAGKFLRPAPDTELSKPSDAAAKPVDGAKKADKGYDKETDGKDDGETKTELEYVKMNNQFVVPIIKDRAIVALVVLALSLEVPEGSKELVYKKEPKLRDSFLQVLFDHANVGGFDGAFTAANNLENLRDALREVGQKNLTAEIVKDVLILEIARQDY